MWVNGKGSASSRLNPITRCARNDLKRFTVVVVPSAASQSFQRAARGVRLYTAEMRATRSSLEAGRKTNGVKNAGS